MSEPLSRPRLRPEVSLVPFSSSTREDTYLAFFPSGRSLQTTRRLYEVMTLLDGSRDPEEIARLLSGMWGRRVQTADVRDWIDRHIAPHDLLAPEPDPPPRPAPKPPRGQGIGLVSARAALPITRRLRLFFRPVCSLPLLLASSICHGLVYAGFSSGIPADLLSSLSVSDRLTGYLLILLSVLFHEFGHLTACGYFRCPHGEIRLGLYLVFPVFHANVSAAWRLRRKERVVVDLAGMYFQLLLTIPASALFLLTRERLWLLLLLELDGLILFSLNPFLRFDGYWLCSDLLGVPNLRSRSRLLLKALWNRLKGGASAEEAPLLRIRPLERFGLFLYAIGSLLFGGLVLVFLCRFLPSRILELPSQARSLLEAGFTNGAEGNVPGALAALVHLLCLCLVLAGAARMLARAVPAGIKAGRKVLCRFLL
jgi:putative peptide zinc metalloprotease protein